MEEERKGVPLWLKVIGVILGGYTFLDSSGGFDTLVSTFNSSTDIGGSETAQLSSQNPIGTTGFSTVLTTVNSTTGGNDPDGVIVFFKKDAVPYTRIEKHANDIYKVFSDKTQTNDTKGIIISKSEKGYEEVQKLFGNKSLNVTIDNLIVLENVIESIYD